MDAAENKRRMLAGELYHAFVPELIAARRRCELARAHFNTARDVTRRQSIVLWKE
jgi:hypothetical protein